ncbi:allantoate amidohydrolase (plasmid) [Photobacterium sp. DA100]|uniref:allantoate amidohydrolase n=1 Tax=Photobacterium sp. DA100 TaxID=3027472 RepID=UPI002478CA9E|nr:allantoate amidohydrolase [Photobacterium sp. DA100]WEM44542.1 allantoate amidohydrolase [Photobacterium sp. DA100]
MTDTSFRQLAETVLAQAEHLAMLSESATELTRCYLTEQHQQAIQALHQWMQDAGMQTWTDAVGNAWGRLPASESQVRDTSLIPRVIIGSHIDTVRNAGKYDGMLGVLAGIAVAEKLNSRALPFHLDVVAFGDEEGTRFGQTLIGSSAVAGEWNPNWLELVDDNGVSLSEAMVEFGLAPREAAIASCAKEPVTAYLELHIEQGPVLEAEDLPVGAVTGIAGAKRYQFEVTGMAGHAGTVPMTKRQDALAGTAEMVLAIETVANNVKDVVATVGQVCAAPGAVNVIAGKAAFSLDIRSLDEAELAKAERAIFQQIDAIAARRGLVASYQEIHRAASVECAPELTGIIAAACEMVTRKSPLSLPSGAGHDAMAMARCCPVGMVFVRCDKGISHHPAEAVQLDDVAVGLEVLCESVLSLALDKESTQGGKE